jgi:hypothetical protein
LNQTVKGLEPEVIKTLDQINDDVQIKILVRDSSGQEEDDDKFKEIFSYQIDQSAFKDFQLKSVAEKQAALAERQAVQSKQQELAKMKQKMASLQQEQLAEQQSAPKPVVEAPKQAVAESQAVEEAPKQAAKQSDIDSAIAKTLEKVKEQERVIKSAEEQKAKL